MLTKTLTAAVVAGLMVTSAAGAAPKSKRSMDTAERSTTRQLNEQQLASAAGTPGYSANPASSGMASPDSTGTSTTGDTTSTANTPGTASGTMQPGAMGTGTTDSSSSPMTTAEPSSTPPQAGVVPQ